MCPEKIVRWHITFVLYNYSYKCVSYCIKCANIHEKVLYDLIKMFPRSQKNTTEKMPMHMKMNVLKHIK